MIGSGDAYIDVLIFDANWRLSGIYSITRDAKMLDKAREIKFAVIEARKYSVFQKADAAEKILEDISDLLIEISMKIEAKNDNH